MKVLIVVGSPRRGNSYNIAKRVENRLKESGNIEIEYLFIKDANLKRCVGCHACVVHGEDKCPLQDDMISIEKMMMEADGIIFASSIYMFHINSLMKSYIDRYAYLVHRPRYFGKKSMVILVRGGIFKKAMQYQKSVLSSWGYEVVSSVGEPELSTLTEQTKEKSIKKIDKAADDFYKGLLKTGIKKPSFYDVIWFSVWKNNAMMCEKKKGPDYMYWKEKGWLEADYYYKTSIGPVKRLVARIMKSIAASMTKKVFKAD